MSRRRFNTRRLLPLMAGVFVAAFSFAFLINKDKTNNADAADLSKFNPGNIISDYVMSNYNSMTEEEIQAWLTAKNPCNNHDHDAYLRYSSEEPWRDWYWKDDHFVCISEELFGDGMVVGEGDTAAHILYETAQEYKINPQVLIVLLQKESGLITDTIPSSKEYRTATGYGCPDTAACDSKYFGFKNQVRRAAALFREVLDGGWTNYPVGINNILYNPNWDCGRLEVNIQNLATSALYRYTPYTPNQAALNAGYGTGDWCSSYGNRNFYQFFVDWFGDPVVKGEVYNGWLIGGEVLKLWQELGGSRSELGNPVSDLISKGTISWQGFENGYIVGSNTTGYYVSMGKIREVWGENGFETGPLGLPVSLIITEGEITYQKYQHGYIVGNEENGYYVLTDKFYEAWGATGYEAGKLGLPLSQVSTKDDIEYQKYQHGYIVGNNKNGYHIVLGKIYEAWGNIGYEEGILGLPIQNEGQNATYGSHWQLFQNGYLVGSDATGYYVSMGKIREAWGATGYEAGELGLPIGDPITEWSIERQEYQKGTIYREENKTWIVKK